MGRFAAVRDRCRWRRGVERPRQRRRRRV